MPRGAKYGSENSRVRVCPVGDEDGDGFFAIALGGSDCDDTDPFTYPLAPDRCENGRPEDCVADRSCAGDVDGDGWIEPAPCENGRSSPMTPEICNGADDDCDGRLDEMLSPASSELPHGERGCTIDPRAIDFRLDVLHCGACGAACDLARSDRCRSATCACGDGPSCAGAQVCRGGSCVAP
jgi:hypothetical protein